MLMVAAEGEFEARFVDDAVACGARADSDAQAPEKILRELEIAAGEDLVHLIMERKEAGQRTQWL